MNLYLESSAVLAWLLGESTASPVRDLLTKGQYLLASQLTLVESERVLIRAVGEGRIDESTASDRRARLRRAASHWHLLRLEGEVIERAKRPFPGEPIRTLDALHLATALLAAASVPELSLLSLDERIRRCGEELGFEVLPR